MDEKLRKDPLLEEAIESLRKARMLVGFVRETLKFPDIRKALREDAKAVSRSLEEAIEATSRAIALTADANAILSLFLYRHLDEEKKEEKNE